LFFVAAEAAIEAGPFEPPHERVTHTWDDRQGSYDSIEEARARIRHGRSPGRVEVEVGQLVEGRHFADTSPARLAVEVLAGGVTIIGAGTEWDKASRAYEAAVVAYEHAVQEPDPEPSAVEPRSEVPPSNGRSGLRRLNENQGIVGLVAIVVTIVIAVVTVLLA
jgi:hypothetical protein